MKLKTLLLKFVVLGISAVFILFGILFYTQIATSEKGFTFDWQTTLFVSVIYFALLLGIIIAYFLLRRKPGLFQSKLGHSQKNRTNDFDYWLRLFRLAS